MELNAVCRFAKITTGVHWSRCKGTAVRYASREEGRKGLDRLFGPFDIFFFSAHPRDTNRTQKFCRRVLNAAFSKAGTLFG